MMDPATLRATRLLLAAVVVALAVQGCSDGDNPTSETDVSSSSVAGKVLAVFESPWVGADEDALIAEVSWAEWGEAVGDTKVRTRDPFLGEVAMLPESQPEELYFGIWGGGCPPATIVSVESPTQFHLDVDDYVPISDSACGDLLQGWAIRVALTRAVDVGAVEVSIDDGRDG